MLTITEKGSGHSHLSVTGAIDQSTVEMVMEVLDAAEADGRFVVDLSEVTRMDGGALGELMATFRRTRNRGVDMRFSSVSPLVREAAARNVSLRTVLYR